jgi:hypothetical protein
MLQNAVGLMPDLVVQSALYELNGNPKDFLPKTLVERVHNIFRVIFRQRNEFLKTFPYRARNEPLSFLDEKSSILDYEKTHCWVYEIDLVVLASKIAAGHEIEDLSDLIKSNEPLKQRAKKISEWFLKEENKRLLKNNDIVKFAKCVAKEHGIENLKALLEQNKDLSVDERAEKIQLWFYENRQILLEITSLNLNELCLTHVPRIINYFRNLITLRLSHNCLTHIPSDFTFYDNLKTLDLDHNYFSTIPNDIVRESLFSLRLDSNRISHLSDGFGANAFYMQRVFLSDNRLMTIPKNFFSDSRYMVMLFFCGNDIRFFPPDFCLSNYEDLDYFTIDTSRKITFPPNFFPKTYAGYKHKLHFCIKDLFKT